MKHQAVDVLASSVFDFEIVLELLVCVYMCLYCWMLFVTLKCAVSVSFGLL